MLGAKFEKERLDMSNNSSARIKFVSIGLLILGAVSATLAYSLRPAKGVKLRPRKGFTLRTQDTTISIIPRQPGPQEITHANTIRYQKSDGTFKQVRTYFNADGAVVKKDILFGIPGQGVFKINNARGPLNFLSSMPPKEKTSYVRLDDGHS